MSTAHTDHDLLRHPLFAVSGPGRSLAHVSLPEALSHLGAGQDVEFLSLRPHQLHPWHAFLVQLGALVAARSGDRSLDRSADAWRDALIDLAGDAGENAWCLVVQDPSRPAFLQVAIPEGEVARYKTVLETPDDLDMLVTAKNHDVKHHLAVAPRPEHWVYALVTLQTFQGFSGRGNYGIARMNSGFGSRPGLAAAPALGWASRFRRDVGVWLEQREALLGPGYEYSPDGVPLLWSLPWDGKTSRPLSACDPFFIEVCRRVRLADEGGRLIARTAPSEAAFLQAKERLGDTGDIWTPVRVTDGGAAALTVSSQGLTYRLLQDVLFGDFERKPALELRDEDGKGPIIVAQVMVRGQGRTDGYHERLIPVPAKAVPFVIDQSRRQWLATLARDRVEKVQTAQRRVLHPALCTLLQGAPDERLDLRDDKTAPWLSHLDRAVDRIFFEDLWRDVDVDEHEQDRRWDDRLLELAREELEDAITAAPIPAARDYRAVTRAESVFYGAARKHLTSAGVFNRPPATEEPTDDERETRA